MTIGHDLKTAAEDTGKALAFPFTHAAQFVALLGSALKDEPAVQAATEQLVKLAEAVVLDGGSDLASKGLNIAGDIATVTAIQAFFSYFDATFLPAVESAYKSLRADVK